MASRKNMRKRRRQRRPSPLPYVIIIIAAVAAVILILFFSSNSRIDSREVSVVELTRTETTTAEGNEGRLTADSNPEVTALMKRMLEAEKDADIDALNDIIVRDDAIDEAALKTEASYTEGFENITCYTINGLVDGTYIVYLCYDQKYLNISTPVPDLHRYYVCTNEDGSLYIDMRSHDGEVDSYMEQVSQWQEVQDLVSSVNDRLQEAVDSDPQLADFMTRLQNGTLNESATEEDTAD